MASSIPGTGDLASYGQIVLFGDSITEQSFNPEFFGHGSAFANLFARRLDVINRGFSGYTTTQALQLVPRIFPDRSDNVKLVFFFFGANDAVLPGFSQHVPLPVYVKNCEDILTSPQLKGKVMAVTPPPIEGYTHEPDFQRTRTAEHTKLYGDALRKSCDRLNIPCADVWSTFMKSLGWNEKDTELPGSFKIAKNELLAGYFRDGLHPVGSGYRLIYKTLLDSLSEHFPHLLSGLDNGHTPSWQQVLEPRAGNPIRWSIDTSTWKEGKYQQYLELLPVEDQQRITKFYFQPDRDMALASTLLQRQFIAEVLGRPEDTIKVSTRDQANRPFFIHKAVRPHDFNVSHHAGLVVLAGLLESGEIGIDLTTPEVLKSRQAVDDYLANFQDSFSPKEWKQIGGDLTRFAQHWALKESYVKATGTGIVVDLPAIEFEEVKYVSQECHMNDDAARLSEGGKRLQWRFELHYLDGKFAAIATRLQGQSVIQPFSKKQL